VVCLSPKVATVYRPRQPRQSPLYQLIERHLPEFERTYDDRYQQRYGPWRPIIGEVARKFLRCGDLHFGFARVQCTGCPHEMFVPFSCQQRCLCPSCHQKRSLLLSERIAQNICQPAPHRQIVWTIPKRLRIFFRFDRRQLGGLARAAWETIVEVYRGVLRRDDVLPGAIAGIQTFGDLIHFHPHVHVIATEGAYRPDGTFICLPPTDTTRLLDVWQRKVFDLLLGAGKIDQELVEQMKGWPHSGFSVDNSVYLPACDTSGLQRLAEYMVRCPFSLARIVRVTESGSVVYRAQKGDCRRFPTPASNDLAGGASRNFQVFEALDFLAELTQHIPDKGEHLVRYFGWYSYRHRGMRAKEASKGEVKIDRRLVDEARSAAQAKSSGTASSWAALVNRVFEVDPLECPHCGSKMKIISFIERGQRDVVEKILRHCGLWEGPLRTLATARSPPASEDSDRDLAEPRELQLVLDPEFL
jgi:hypothetical protein